MTAKETDTLSAEQLYRELEAVESLDDEEPEDNQTAPGAEIIEDVRTDLALGREFRFDDELVKRSLDELLLVLIALSDDGAHGKQLMSDLATFFDAHLSPGTVYPRLHDLEEAGVLEVHELVKTKKYSIADTDRARRRVHQTLQHHLAIGSVFHTALDDI